ncbi:MAG TPA: CocE/NonD family hydrolase [Mycobacteriales bacterium]|nr:CocE/NonD family hydrolase [Mycobacteriales bacterium]
MTEGLTVEFDVPATMRDGTVLKANIYRPAGAGPWPVLLTRTPYGKDFAFGGAGIDPAAAVKRGYILIIQDTRGRFESEGIWRPMAAEVEDGADSVTWAAGIPGSDGTVAMHGGSYLGFTQWAAAHGAPPALKAIAPAVTWCDPFEGLGYRGGALEFGMLVGWSFGVGVDVLAKRHPDDLAARLAAVRAHATQFDEIAESGFFSLPLQDFSPLESQRSEAIYFEAVTADRSRDTDLARRLSVDEWTAAHDIPAFNIGGWYDIFLAGTIANYQAGGRDSRLLIGPWSHGAMNNPVGERNFGFGAQAGSIELQQDLGSLQLDWFDRWCKGAEAPETPPIRIFVMGANVWRYEAEWPLRRARTTPFHLDGAGGLAESEPAGAPDEYVYDPNDPVPTLGGATLLPPEFRSGAYDQRPVEQRADVLTYSTVPLTEDVEVTGPIEVRLWASSSAPNTDFVARLCDVFPDGRSINLTDGIVRGEALEPEKPHEFVIDLWATSNVFRAGHRIRVDITSSSFPRWDRNPNTGHELGADAELQKAQQRIYHDPEHPSRILLPVVP